jgi:hypothetical protein
MVSGLSLALSVNERLPEAAPAALGVNVRATVQVPEAATGLRMEQVVPEVAMANGPVTVRPVKVKPPVPVLVRVTVWAGLVVPTGSEGKVGAADRLTAGAVPVPVRLTDCVLPATPLLLSVIVSVPVRVPTAVGVKVTLIVQLPPAATGAEQVSVSAKSPLGTMLVMVKGPVPVLLSVTVQAPDGEPTC